MAEGLGHVGTLVLPAVALHVLLALPRGELPRQPADARRRRLRSPGQAWGSPSGPASAIESSAVIVTAWLAALALGLPGAHATYLRTAGLERQRLQWVGCGAAMAIEAALVIGALDLLVDWPRNAVVAAGAFTLLIPVAMAASASPRLAARVDRLLVHTVSVAGLTADHRRRLPRDRRRSRPDPRGRRPPAARAVDGGAGIAAALYLPARERLSDLANRLVYGERHAPDEVLRTFGSRLSRAIPMDELLLQLAESLRKTLALTRAEVWTGTPRACSSGRCRCRTPTPSSWWSGRRSAASWRGPACRVRPGFGVVARAAGGPGPVAAAGRAGDPLRQAARPHRRRAPGRR